MKKIKMFKAYFKLKKRKYNKHMRMVYYAMNNIITFNEYEKYFDKRIRRNKKKWLI